MLLNKAIEEGKLHLTEKEKQFLTAVINEGSYFYEAGGNEEVQQNGCCFIGWEIYESEIKGVRGVVSSLVKKGVIDACNDDGCTGYWILYELEITRDEKNNYVINFGTDMGYDKKDLKKINAKRSVKFYNELTELIGDFICYTDEEHLTIEDFINFKNQLLELKEEEEQC